MNDFLRMPILYCVIGIALAGLFEPIRADWWGLIVLGVLIGLYGFLAKGERDGSRFQTGDNCYFIGFVYTLSIITASLIFDAESLLAGAGEGSLHPLLKTIGIALGTSVVGMLLRFWLTYDIRVGEDRFDSEVHRAAAAAAELSSVVKGLHKTLEDGSKAFAAQTRASEAHVKDLFESFRSGVDAGVRETISSLRAAADAAVASIGRQESSLTETTTSAAQVLRSNTAALSESMAASLARISSSLDDYAQALHAATERVAGTLDRAAEEAIEKFADGFADALQANTAMRDSLQGISSALEDYAQAVRASAQRVGGTLEQAAQDAVRRIEDRLTQTLQTNTFGDAREALDAIVRAHREGIVGVNQTLASAMTGLQEAMKRAVAYAEDARGVLTEMDEAGQDGHLEGLGRAMERFRDRVSQVNGELSALAANQEAAAERMAQYGEELARVKRGFGMPPTDSDGQHEAHEPKKRRWWRWWNRG